MGGRYPQPLACLQPSPHDKKPGLAASCGAPATGPQVRLYVCRFMTGGGGGGSLSDAVNCLRWCRSKNVTITNNSWGGAGFSQALLDEILVRFGQCGGRGEGQQCIGLASCSPATSLVNPCTCPGSAHHLRAPAWPSLLGLQTSNLALVLSHTAPLSPVQPPRAAGPRARRAVCGCRRQWPPEHGVQPHVLAPIPCILLRRGRQCHYSGGHGRERRAGLLLKLWGVSGRALPMQQCHKRPFFTGDGCPSHGRLCAPAARPP